jgi:hypothetical protein
MGISRMMSQQVQQSEEAMQTLGKKEEAFPTQGFPSVS